MTIPPSRQATAGRYPGLERLRKTREAKEAESAGGALTVTEVAVEDYREGAHALPAVQRGRSTWRPRKSYTRKYVTSALRSTPIARRACAGSSPTPIPRIWVQLAVEIAPDVRRSSDAQNLTGGDAGGSFSTEPGGIGSHRPLHRLVHAPGKCDSMAFPRGRIHQSTMYGHLGRVSCCRFSLSYDPRAIDRRRPACGFCSWVADSVRASPSCPLQADQYVQLGGGRAAVRAATTAAFLAETSVYSVALSAIRRSINGGVAFYRGASRPKRVMHVAG